MVPRIAAIATSGGGADKDKDIDSHSNQLEDDEHSDALSHCTYYMLSSYSEGDPGYSNESYNMHGIR